MSSGHAIQPATAVQDLIIPDVLLVTKGGPRSRPLNIIYSTNPELALDASGAKYCIKGADDAGIVLAEQVLAAKQADPAADTQALESEIDTHVFRLYALTPAEIALVKATATK